MTNKETQQHIKRNKEHRNTQQYAYISLKKHKQTNMKNKTTHDFKYRLIQKHKYN